MAFSKTFGEFFAILAKPKIFIFALLIIAISLSLAVGPTSLSLGLFRWLLLIPVDFVNMMINGTGYGAIPVQDLPLYWLPLHLAFSLLVLLLVGALTSMVRDTISEKKIDVTKAFKLSFNKFLKLFFISLIVFLIIFCGSIALVVPGILLSAFLFYFLPITMFENYGIMDTLKKSWGFSKGKRWRIGLIVTILLIALIIIRLFILPNDSVVSMIFEIVYLFLYLVLHTLLPCCIYIKSSFQKEPEDNIQKESQVEQKKRSKVFVPPELTGIMKR